MINYIIRRLLYVLPVLVGVNILTFVLFFVVNSPDDMARMQLGDKHVSQAAVDNWKQQRGYDLPLLWNEQQQGLQRLEKTIFFEKSVGLFVFDFGLSDNGRDIMADISQRMWPSLAIAIPSLIFGVLANITFALLLIFYRGSYLESSGLFLCIALMSISGLFYIIAGQYFVGKLLALTPISGYVPGLDAFRFIVLPVFIGVVSGLGSGARWYRTLFLEEAAKDYVRTAKAKGLSELEVLFRHVLNNAMIPILTGIVVILPSLFMGSLIIESFFGIPGLGSYTIDAISSQDFAIVRAMVFLGSFLYIIGLLLTDISYTFVDPRVRLD
ncbi:MAG: ABC transporter permease [Cycloclasticus sp.]|jgi:ABC-type dipeptide/oligopeptide/nickel transport systems, permease components|nr:peptide ABC transporter permease [Cycloclasticus sp. 46_83_sub15_T18]